MVEATNMPRAGVEAAMRYTPEHYQGPAFDALTESVRQHGIMVALVLSASGTLVDGYRRALAGMRVGLTHFPVVVNPKIDTPEKEIAALVATETRSDRNPVDHGRFVLAYLRQHDLTQRDAARRLNLAEATVSRLLLPFAYDAEIVAAVGDGTLSVSHLTAVNPLGDLSRQAELLRQARDAGESAAALKKRAFPPKRKAGGWRYAADGVGLTVARGVDLDTLLKVLTRVKEKVDEAAKTASKRQLPVAQVLG